MNSIAKTEQVPSAGARVQLVFIEAGGGHRASAMALQSVLAKQKPNWRVEAINLRDLLEPLDFIRRLTGLRVEDFYNGLLKKNLTAGIGPMVRMLHLLVRQMHPGMVTALTDYWTRERPDLVVSLIPHFNRAMFEGLRKADALAGEKHTPIVTVLTDLADYPPNFWIERQEQYVICGTTMAARQALAAGLPDRLVLRSSGMIVQPEFYRIPEISRAQERERLGFHPELPTGIVMFGGYGSHRMEMIARRVAASGLKTQLLFMCGHNQKLAVSLQAMKLPFPHHIVGFTDQVPYFMRLADYFIGKPGPGSLSEALVVGLPLIVERNALTMAHERFNTDWVLQNGIGAVVRSFAEAEKAIAPMLDPEQMNNFRQHVAAMRNRAVFEIPGMLESIMAAAGATRVIDRLGA
ncbi:MAG TPA: glycosyltransferase [Candidatus Binataceae bacterium]|nr:glycosyltransferase [Candidatus Binataceae bacterium]